MKVVANDPAPGTGEGSDALGSTRMLRGSALFFSGRLIGAGATFASHWVLARWLGATQQGQYADIFSWVILLANLVVLGLPRAGLRFLPQALESGQTDLIHGFAVYGRRLVCVLSLTLLLCAAPLLFLLRPPALHPGTWTALVGLACVPVLGWIRQSAGVAHGLSWFRLTVVPAEVLRPVAFLGLLLAAWGLAPGTGAPGVMGIQLAVLLAVALWQSRLMGRRLRPLLAGTPTRMQGRVWVRTSAPLLLLDLFNHTYPELNVAIVGRLMTDEQVGVYFIGFRVAFLIAFGLIAVDQATLPNASRAYAAGRLGEMQALIQRASRLKLAGSLVGLVVLASLGRPLLASFSREGEYAAAYGPMLVLAVMLVVRAAIGPVADLLGITGHHDRTLRVSVVSMLATVALHLWLVPRYGLMGAAIAPLVVTTVSHLWMLRYLVSEVGIVPSVVGGRSRA